MTWTNDAERSEAERLAWHPFPEHLAVALVRIVCTIHTIPSSQIRFMLQNTRKLPYLG